MVLFRLDPCGIICIGITYLAVFYADYVLILHLVVPIMSNTLWGAINVLGFNLIVFLIVVSHMRAILSDPGIVPLPTASLDFSDLHTGKSQPNLSDGWTVCMRCETYRPPRAHHCRVCRRCIRKMDHHCPWINNCVGEFNQKFFIQFLFYVGLASIHSVAMVITTWVMDPGVKGDFKHFRLIHSILLVIESLLFGLFVIAIGCDQITAIFNDETAVEQVKKEGPRRQKKSNFVLLQEVFGRGHPALWLCPLQFHTVSVETPPQYNV